MLKYNLFLFESNKSILATGSIVLDTGCQRGSWSVQSRAVAIYHRRRSTVHSMKRLHLTDLAVNVCNTSQTPSLHSCTNALLQCFTTLTPLVYTLDHVDRVYI